MTIQFDDEKEARKLEELRKVEEEDLVRILAEAKYGIPSIDLSGQTVENEALRLVDEPVARALEVAPFKLLGKNLYLAIRTPEKDGLEELRQEIEKKGYGVAYYMASRASLEKVWARYKELSYASSSKVGGIDISGEVVASIGEKVRTISDVQQAIDDSTKENKTHRISHILEILLGGGIAINASDIHIEPEEADVHVRFRLDGVLQDVMKFDMQTYKLLNSRIKLLSGLKLTTSLNAQDGRFSIFLGTDEISIRTSMIPGAYGESIVMRILNPKSIQVNLEDLGIPEKLLAIINQEIKKPNGLILLTGPTGSGKTTTLYAFLRKIYSTQIKIITIEDPVEYHLPGITQTQTENEKGYTFLEGLRSALRQDPDVIMVGEIRDDETGKIAVESALTGHLVFSTLHTNNAAGVIPRLIDLSVNPKTLVSALSLSMAQRLVRKLCTNCRKERDPNAEEKNKMDSILAKAEQDGKHVSEYGLTLNAPYKIYDAVGCEKCNNTGYKGRCGIYEAIKTDEAIEKLIVQSPSERDIRKIARSQGILDMREDGVIKVIKGVTSLEEVKSVVDLDEE
jgi:type IV pilus assembly protein PilB